MNKTDISNNTWRTIFNLFLGRDPEDVEINILKEEFLQNEFDTLWLIRRLVLNEEIFFINRRVYIEAFYSLIRYRYTELMPPKVNLFHVGTSRSGSSFISSLLSTSNEICVSPIKESNFFRMNSNEAVKDCFSEMDLSTIFLNWNGERYLADLTPDNLFIRNCASKIYEYNPLSKIIIGLRDPVERAISDVQYLYPHKDSSQVHKFFQEAIENFANKKADINSDILNQPWNSAEAILLKGLYYKNLKEYFNIFNDNILIYKFEEFQNISLLCNKIGKFLGIDSLDFDFNHSGIPINSSKKIPNISKDSYKILTDFYAEDIELTNSILFNKDDGRICIRLISEE